MLFVLSWRLVWQGLLYGIEPRVYTYGAVHYPSMHVSLLFTPSSPSLDVSTIGRYVYSGGGYSLHSSPLSTRILSDLSPKFYGIFTLTSLTIVFPPLFAIFPPLLSTIIPPLYTTTPPLYPPLIHTFLASIIHYHPSPLNTLSTNLSPLSTTIPLFYLHYHPTSSLSTLSTLSSLSPLSTITPPLSTNPPPLLPLSSLLYPPISSFSFSSLSTITPPLYPLSLLLYPPSSLRHFILLGHFFLLAHAVSSSHSFTI